MENIDVAGTQGAKLQSFKTSNPRALLERLWKQNRQCSKDELFEIFRHKILRNNAMIDTIIGYWFDNNFRSLTTSETTTEERMESRKVKRDLVEEKTKTIRAAITEKIEEESVRLLETILLPNNVCLGDSTGLECVKAGGWLKMVGKMVGKNRVRDVLSNKEILRIYKSYF